MELNGVRIRFGMGKIYSRPSSGVAPHLDEGPNNNMVLIACHKWIEHELA